MQPCDANREAERRDSCGLSGNTSWIRSYTTATLQAAAATPRETNRLPVRLACPFLSLGTSHLGRGWCGLPVAGVAAMKWPPGRASLAQPLPPPRQPGMFPGPKGQCWNVAVSGAMRTTGLNRLYESPAFVSLKTKFWALLWQGYTFSLRSVQGREGLHFIKCKKAKHSQKLSVIVTAAFQ